MRIIMKRVETSDGGWETEVFKQDAVGRRQSVAFHKKNGISISEGFYEDGERHGVWTWYHNLNEVQRKELYDHGQLQVAVFYIDYRKGIIDRIEKQGKELYLDGFEAKSLLKKMQEQEKQQTSLHFIKMFEGQKDKEAEQIQQENANPGPVPPKKMLGNPSLPNPNQSQESR